MLIDKTWGLFPPDKQPRRFIKWLAASEIFEKIMFVTIMVSVFVLALYSVPEHAPPRDGSEEGEMSQITSCDPAFPADLCGPHLELLWFIQRVCMFIFVAEFFILTIANGLFAYLSSFMNCLDFFVTSLSVIAACGVSGVLPFMILRMTRIIRPLKKLSQSSPAIMSILTALENSSRGLFAVITFGFFVWTTIAVVGMQLYQGKVKLLYRSNISERNVAKGLRTGQDQPLRPRPGKLALQAVQVWYFDGPNNTYSDGLPYIGWPSGRTIWGPNATNSRGCKVKYPIKHPQYNRLGEIVESVESFKIEKAFYNFDNFWQAIGSAFAMFTFDDWHKLVLQCVNAKTVGSFPQSRGPSLRDDAAVLLRVCGL